MNIQQITDKIANLQRAMKTATTVVLKNKLKNKVAELKEDLKNANVPTSKLAKSLLGSQRKVANYTKAEFKSAIKTLAKRDEYSFLKRYTIGEIEDDRERYAKPVGWRFKGRNNIKKPTAKELAIGKARGTVYYESRPNRSDVVRPVKLAKGGSTDLSQKEKEILADYKKTIIKKYNDWIAETENRDLKKLFTKDLNDHLYLIERMEYGSWLFAYKFWAGMDTASREEITNDAYDLLMEKNNMPTYAKGGSLNQNSVEQENIDMVKNQAIQVEHHAKELMATLKSNPRVDAWVVAKMDRATQNLSDITHYLDGEEKSYAKGGTMHPKGFKIDLDVESKMGNHEHFEVGKMKGYGDALVSRSALQHNAPDNYKYSVTATNKYAKGGDVMPFEKYEEIHEEIHENKYEKGGSVANAVDKHIATVKASEKHGYSIGDYKMAHKHYAKGGQIGDSGLIEDPNSLYKGKMGVIVGESGNHFLVKTINGTGLVKKTRIKIIADDYGQGGNFKKKDEYAQGGNITKKLDYLSHWNGLTVNQSIEIINALNDAGITDEDLKIKSPKKLGGGRYRELKDKKAREIWVKAKPYYKGSLEGNWYFGLVTDLIHEAMQGETILEDWKNNPIYSGVYQDVVYKKPYKFNDDWRFGKGGMTEKEQDSEYILYDLFKNKAKANYSKFCELALKKGYSPIEIDEWYEEHNEDEYAKGGVTKKEFVGKKVGQVMHEFKHGELHSGRSGKIVKKRKQAVAIALNVANEGWKHRKKK
jgi:ribosomal protein L21E